MKKLNIINSVTRTYSRSTQRSDLIDKLKSAGLTNYKINSFISTMKNSVKQSKQQTTAASNDKFRSATLASYKLNTFVSTMKKSVKPSNEEITATDNDKVEIYDYICIPLPSPQSDILGRDGCWGVWSCIWLAHLLKKASNSMTNNISLFEENATDSLRICNFKTSFKMRVKGKQKDYKRRNLPREVLLEMILM